MKPHPSYNKILCVGCSHASSIFASKPWPYWLANELECEYDVLASPGAGIQIGVDKLALKLSQEKYDLVVFQTPHELRLSIGMNHDPSYDKSKENQPWEINGNKIGEHFIMGLNPSNNVHAMNKFFGGNNLKLYKHFNRWYMQYVADNSYEINVKFLQSLWMVQSLCDQYHTPSKIFYWHGITEIKSELYNSWKRILRHEDIIEGNVVDYLNINGMANNGAVHEEYSDDKYHLNDTGSSSMVKEYLLPKLQLSQ